MEDMELQEDMIKLLAITLVLVSVSASENRWHYCHGDYCDEETQFCSDEFQRCRRCSEVLDDCLTNRLPKNCTRVCIQDQFEKQMKKERERKCAEPKPLLNGYHNGSQKALYDQGDVITIKCNPGYRLAGNYKITCKDFGVWSNDLPICEEMTCSNLSPIRNGFWSSSGIPKERHVAGDILEAVCDEGYLMYGTAIWNCSNDGNWKSSDFYFPFCFQSGKTVDYRGWVIAAVVALCVLNIIQFVCCCKQRCTQNRRNQQEKSEDTELTESNENTEILDSFEKLLESKMNPGKSVSFRHLNENQEKESLLCPDLPQPNTRPEERTRELIRPVQPESSNENISENGHDTCRKTLQGYTYRAAVPSSDLRFPEQQAANNEQDLAQKIAISSDDINKDDIA